jgi:hypothetical protein
MIKAVLKNTLIMSFLGHLLVFSLFSFSFDRNRLQRAESLMVFWGQILPKAALNFNNPVLAGARQISKRLDSVLPKSSNPVFNPPADYSIKPQVELPISPSKEPAIKDTPAASQFLPEKKESSIMFHPLLPYQLQIYFKGRQTVHIELMFKISSLGGKNTVLIERKVSSGNLEADLLSSRYIKHYLFIQRARFPLDTWQTVKIDLSTQND